MSLCVHLFTSMLEKRNTRQCINNSVRNKRTKTIVEQYMQHWQLFRQAGDYHNDLESFTNFSQRFLATHCVEVEIFLTIRNTIFMSLVRKSFTKNLLTVKASGCRSRIGMT